MQDDLISRQAAIKALTEAYEDIDAEWILNKLPSAKDTAVSHWEYKNRHRKYFRRYTGVDDYGETHTITVKEECEGPEPYCARCGAQAAESWMNYCPKCGADMREEE